MCCHNEDDYDCAKCCYEYGVCDAIENLPYSPTYKNLEQIDEYKLGYEETLKDILIAREMKFLNHD